jgi:hypothetical protein
MESGRLLLVDRPEVVIADQRVVESYLGGDVTAIQRSRSNVAAVAAS